MESSGTPAPASGSGTTPPPPPPPPADRSDDKAGGGWRALAVVLALLLAFGVAVMFVVASNPDDVPRCEQITSGVGVIECYDITETQETIQMVFAWAAGVVGAIAVLLALAFAATGRRGSRLVKATVAALALGAIVVVIGQL